jgi:hypothetical protein
MGKLKKLNKIGDTSVAAAENTIDLVDLPKGSEIEVRTDTNNKKTASKAVKILTSLNQGFREPNKTERINLLVAFAKKNKVLYGKAFDVIKITGGKSIDLENLSEVEKNLGFITVCEIKSTNKKEITKDFNRYFFGLTTAELLVAQSLRNQFQFVFVNINTEEFIEMTLKEIFGKAKGIYPVWSIQF